MKQLLAFTLIVLSISCTHSTTNEHAPFQGSWTMTSVIINETAQRVTRPANLEREVLVTFNTDQLLSGFTPSNQILPSPYVSGSGNRLSIPSVARTKMFESTWGSYFLDNITGVTTYSVEGDRLKLITPSVILEFRK